MNIPSRARLTILRPGQRGSPTVGATFVALIALPSLVTACGGARSQPAASPVAAAADREASQLARAIADDLWQVANLPGLSIAVARDGELVFAEGFGYADIEAKRPVTPTTRFRAASVSKIITATGLAELIQDGRIDLDAPIDSYVPSFPSKGSPITSRQLAGHLAGIPHYLPTDRKENRFYSSVAEALGVFAHHDLLAEPGTEYAYSTHGYTLLSAVMEAAAGRPFLEYMRTAVFRPLGMRGTGPELHAQPDPNRATLYEWQEGALSRIALPEDPSYKWAGGGMLTTPSDLVRMADAYLGGTLRSAVVETMFTSQRLRSGEETGVGIGWRNARDMAGRRVMEHAGSMGGVRSVISIFPEERLAIAVMTNREWSSQIEETGHMIALPFLQPPTPSPQPVGTAGVRLELLDVRGEARQVDGVLTMDGQRGELVVDPGGAEAAVYKLVYLNRDDVYALIRPDGVFHLTLQLQGGVIRGRAIGYGSPRLTSPAGNPAFLSFEGAFLESK